MLLWLMLPFLPKFGNKISKNTFISITNIKILIINEAKTCTLHTLPINDLYTGNICIVLIFFNNQFNIENNFVSLKCSTSPTINGIDYCSFKSCRILVTPVSTLSSSRTSLITTTGNVLFSNIKKNFHR